MGTNGEIYNIVFDHPTGIGSGWKSLGGPGRQYVSLDSFVTSHNLIIQTVGTHGHPYCDDLSAIGWGGWYRCG